MLKLVVHNVLGLERLKYRSYLQGPNVQCLLRRSRLEDKTIKFSQKTSGTDDTVTQHRIIEHKNGLHRSVNQSLVLLDIMLCSLHKKHHYVTKQLKYIFKYVCAMAARA
jgi:hypothetical protein